MSNIKTITIRMSQELHTRLKLKMVKEGKTIQDHVIELIEKDLKKGDDEN